MLYIVGIDPGSCGGVALLSTDRKKLVTQSLHNLTPRDTLNYLKNIATDLEGHDLHCFFEQVWAAQQQSASASFKFGYNTGILEGFLLSQARISYEFVTPNVWQSALNITKRGDDTKSNHKKKLKMKAQQLYPTHKFTLDTADATLIAEYGCRVMKQRLFDTTIIDELIL
jgi:hypothetical protein